MTALAFVLMISTRTAFRRLVDEDGMPRGTSYAVAALLTLAFVIGAARLASVGWAVDLALGGTLLVGVGIALLNEESPVSLAMGHVLFLFGGLGVAWGVTLTLTYAIFGLRPVVFLLVCSLWLAMLGAVGAGTNAIGDGRVTTALEQGWAVVIVLIVAFVPLALVVAALLWLAPGVATWLAAPGGSRPALASLLVLLGLVGLGVRYALGRLPVVQLAPRGRRERAAGVRDAGRRAGAVLGVVGLLGSPVVALFDLLGATGRAYGSLPEPAVVVAAAATNTPLLRAPLLALLLALAVVVPVVVFVRGLTREDRPDRRYALAFGVAVLALVPVSLLARFVMVVRSGGEPTTLPVVFGILVVAYLLVVGATVFFLLLASVLPVAAGAGLLPDRGAGVALMAGGVFLATVSLGLGGAPGWAVFAGVGAALVVWDLSEFGLGLAEELGRRPDARRVELLHGVGSVAVVAVGVGLAAGLEWTAGAAVASGSGALAAAVAALVGTALLFGALGG